jgi:hypothetical protein
MSSSLWPSLAASVVLLIAAVALVRTLRRGHDAATGRRPEPRGARDAATVDRIEQDLRALHWLWQQGRISTQEYRRARERAVRD